MHALFVQQEVVNKVNNVRILAKNLPMLLVGIVLYGLQNIFLVPRVHVVVYCQFNFPKLLIRLPNKPNEFHFKPL